MIQNIQALRGVAAGLVFLIHVLRPNMGADWLVYKMWWVGPAGVDLFFVISGFIVSLTAVRAATADPSAPVAALKFAAKRLLRIFPLYWIVLTGALLADGHVELAPAWLPQMPMWRLVTLMTIDNNKVLLAWTLAYELLFYAVLSLIISWFPRRVFQALGWWLVGSVAAVMIAMGHGTQYFEFLPASPLMLEFGAGCVVAYLTQQGVKAWGKSALVVGIILFGVAAWTHSQFGNWQPAFRVVFAFPCALIVYGAVTVEEAGLTAPKWLQRLGDASYSIYIWHQLVVGCALVAFESLGLVKALPGVVVLVLAGGIALGVGFASYRFIEKPLQNWVGRTIRSSRPEAQTASAT